MDDAIKLESLLAQARYIQLGPFLTGVVHDLNNGIGAVIAYSELIGMGNHSRDELDRMLEDLTAAARRVADLNDAVSTITRREALKAKAVPIAPLIGQIALIVEYRFRASGVAIDVSIEGDASGAIVCFRNELARAMIYILVNALENVQDAPRKQVWFSTEVSTGSIIVRIRDTGPALGADEFARAIEPYYTTKPPPHLGLGLTAVKSIADLHGGTLGYEPESGVTLRIPDRSS